ncbi:HAD-like domain-containing protein [Kockovaella imperatae]|uniref:HAD-like domain-containing protein n=1 Tax=Kockovaella imperatae TaxID=4999 RepID=A0A1Y1UFK7_9TREE|nr:HAD-like domain-containing protein [Kockovaella imperatae]ORX36841.1 HAD-like domain-containing protein [Kockovaella imperatae]
MPESSKEMPSKGKGKGKIAVDMDDVLCQTNGTIVEMHNEIWKTEPPLELADFKNYLYWQNRGWSSPTETVKMVARLFDEGLCHRAQPIPGVKEGLLRLKQMGYSLIIVTARGERERKWTEDWIATHLPDIFDEIHFTGAFAHVYTTAQEKEGHVAKKAVMSHHKRSKADVVHETEALFLIDDSAENALDASRSKTPCQVLLFGDWPWNRIIRDPDDRLPEDVILYVDAKDKGLLDRVESRRQELIERNWIPHGVERVSNWEQVIEWVEDWEKDGCPPLPRQRASL